MTINPNSYLGESTAAATQAHAGRSFVATGLVCAMLVCGLSVAITGMIWSGALAGALGGFGLAMALAGWAFRAQYPHRQLGLCNIVTLARLGMTSALFGAIFAQAPAIWLVLAIALVAFLLDGADGWLARRSGLTSDFGARFDMEVDSAFALILAALAVKGGLSPLVLLLGLPRYGFGIAQIIWPALTAPLPDRFSRKVVCVVQIAVLILLVLPVLSPGLRHVLAALAGALVIWSFALDIRLLRRGRG